jgi:SAM-dependent methyltransferase
MQRFLGAHARVLEIGCGTGHWLRALRAEGYRAIGVDPSPGMLAQCTPPVVRACAEALPFADQSFERIVVVNALHHFREPLCAVAEMRRVARGVIIVGLDPSTGLDRWPVYDYFDGTLERDRARFPSTAQLRAWLLDAGFAHAQTEVAETMRETWSGRDAVRVLGRHTTSQLSDLSDEAYARGLARIDPNATLESELRLYATTAHD